MPPNKEQREYLKEWLDPVNDLDNTAGNTVKPFDNRVALWEHYVGSRVALHLHIGFVQRGKPYAKDLCADFEALISRKDEVLGADIVKNTSGKEKLVCRNQDCIYHPVFVPVRQGMEDGECLVRRVKSLVRLKFMDDCPMVGEYVSESAGARKLFRDDILTWGFDDYRESDLAGPVARRAFASHLVEGELPNDVVQDATQVVNHVANQDAEVEQGELRDCYGPKDMIARLRIELTDDSYLIGLSQEQGTDFGIKRVAVFPRPLQLRPASTEVRSVAHD